MTLDDDTGHFHPSPPRKSYNPFDSDDDKLDSPGLKPENVYTKEDHIGFDLKALDESADALNFCMDSGNFSWEEAVFGEPAVNASANGQLYTDKNVTECELPEILVCYKENNYQSVKDIGIDEGVPIHDKIWVQSREDETKDSSSLLALSRKSDDAMNTEKGYPEVDVVEIPKSKLDCEWKKDDDDALHPSVEGLSEGVVNGQYEDCIKITELQLDVEDKASETDSYPAAETDPKKNDSKLGELVLIGKDGPDHDDTVEKKGSIASPDKVDSVVVQEPITGESTPSEVSTECREAIVNPDKSPNEEKTLPISSEDVAVQEPAYNSDSNIKLESGKQEEASENVEHAKPPTAQSMTRQEEAKSSNSAVASLESRFHGETSFSSITFTGPVAYSGNISLRSESSAGSTRSFAFPILQTEWNSSPERMVKADQRHLRKQKGGWVQALVCCRF